MFSYTCKDISCIMLQILLNEIENLFLNVLNLRDLVINNNEKNNGKQKFNFRYFIERNVEQNTNAYERKIYKTLRLINGYRSL